MTNWLTYVPVLMASAALMGVVVSLYKLFFADPKDRRQAEINGNTARLAAEIEAHRIQLEETDYWRDQVPALRDELKVQADKFASEITYYKMTLERERQQYLQDRRDMQAVIDDLRNRITLLEAKNKQP